MSDTSPAAYDLRSPAARQPLLVSARRSALLEDANSALGGVGADIRRPLRVSFISEHGYEEAGVDQGGLTKEFLEEARCPPPPHAPVKPANRSCSFGSRMTHVANLQASSAVPRRAISVFCSAITDTR